MIATVFVMGGEPLRENNFMQCPYCMSRLAMQGLTWIEYGKRVTAGICYSKHCESKGKPIKIEVREK